MESIDQVTARSAGIRRTARSLLVFSLFTAISAGMAANAKAQTFAEWFDQKNTQKKYLLQQISSLALYANYLKQGNHIASGGLLSISASLINENVLHQAYYNRLKTAPPVVRNSPMVHQILSWQQNVLTTLGQINQFTGFTAAEQGYLESVRNAVFQDCDHQMSTLQLVTGDNKVKMSDAERFELISKIHTAMSGNFHFAASFMAQVRLYAAQRQQEKQQSVLTGQYYGIKE